MKEKGEKVKVLQEDFKVIDNCLCIRMPEEVDHHHADEICRMAGVTEEEIRKAKEAMES